MLRYDAAWLIEQYREEAPVLPGVPYTRLGGAGPYRPRRAPRQSVFPGGYHCTASGETVWTGAHDFEGLFTENICRELEEEVALARADLEWLRPVAFCREFLRAGKPQFFFAAGT